MTGFGKMVKEFDDKTITVEMRSLNSKQMDLSLRLPSAYKNKEIELRSMFTKELERGKIDVSIYIDYQKKEPEIEIDQNLALSYSEKLKNLSVRIEADSSNLLELILKMPDVVKNQRKEVDEKEWEQIMETIHFCLEELNNFRIKEGNVLLEDLKIRLENILENLKKIEHLDALRKDHIKNRIKKNLKEIISEISIDQNRFEQEIIYYLERLDITEEKVRLKAHCDHFLNTVREPSSGRKINFISQEIGREINTIGSKANDSEIQKLVVEMKDELEKIKEQSMNML